MRTIFRFLCYAGYSVLSLLYLGGWIEGVAAIGKAPWHEVQPWLGGKPEITAWVKTGEFLSFTMKRNPQLAAEYAKALQLQTEAADSSTRYVSPSPCRLRAQSGRILHENVDIRLESGSTFCTLEITARPGLVTEPRTIPARYGEEPAYTDWMPPAGAAFLKAHGRMAKALDTLLALCGAALFAAPCLLVDGALLLKWRRAPQGKPRWAKWILLPVAALVPSFLLQLASLPTEPLSFVILGLFFIILGAVSALFSLMLGGASTLLTTSERRQA